MGFENRDYYREESGPSFFTAAGSAVKVLIAVNIAVFLLQILTTGNGTSASRWIWFDADLIRRGEVWRFVTWGFGYQDGQPLAFIFEMLFIWWFGKSLEEMYGTREFSLFYAASILVAATASFVAALGPGGDMPIVGAFAPVMAVTVLFAWHFPTHQILLFFLIPVPIWVIVAIYVVVSLYESAASGFASGPFVAGLTAVAFGLLYGWADRRISDLVPSGRPKFRMPRRKPKLRVFEPEQREDLDKRVDEILAKIHEQGEASLTDRERRTLQEASRRYKKT